MSKSARLLLALVLCATVAACDDGTSEPTPGFPLDVPNRDGGPDLTGDVSGDASLGFINVISPKAGGIYRGSVPLEFVIAPEPGTTIVGSPVVTVGGAPIAVSPGAAPNSWVGTITSFRLEPAPLVMAEEQLLLISASDSIGNGLRSTTSFFFDDAGPTITNVTPDPDLISGGVIKVSATIRDRAGVRPPVTAFIGNRAGIGTELTLLRESPQSEVFSTWFDTRVLTSCGANTSNNLCVIYPNVSFRAVDVLGNENVVAYDVAIDNQPPLADFDPENIRLIKQGDNGAICSHAFDPVGNYRGLGDPPNDGCGVGQLFRMRAQIEDKGNLGTGIRVSPISLVDGITVMAYVLDDTTQPLVVDTNGDGICDDVNPLLVPTTKTTPKAGEVLAVRLKPIAPAGAGDYTPSDPPFPPQCMAGQEKRSPPAFCEDVGLPMAIGYPNVHDKEAAIWTVEPLNAQFCSGAQFDTHANQISDGWACLAVVAADKVGNRGASHPLRVYVDKELKVLSDLTSSCPLAPSNDRIPPNCTGRFDRATRQLVPGTCTAPRITSSVRADSQ